MWKSMTKQEWDEHETGKFCSSGELFGRGFYAEYEINGLVELRYEIVGEKVSFFKWEE